MKILLVALIILLGFFFSLISLSIVIYPEWLNINKTGLIIGAFISCITLLSTIFSYLRNFTEVFKK